MHIHKYTQTQAHTHAQTHNPKTTNTRTRTYMRLILCWYACLTFIQPIKIVVQKYLRDCVIPEPAHANTKVEGKDALPRSIQNNALCVWTRVLMPRFQEKLVIHTGLKRILLRTAGSDSIQAGSKTHAYPISKHLKFTFGLLKTEILVQYPLWFIHDSRANKPQILDVVDGESNLC